MKRLLLLGSVLFLAGNSVLAQAFLRPHEWKKYRREVFFTTGTANFLGDLGGRNKKGTDYSPADLDLNQSRTAFGVGYRYRFHKLLSASGKFSYLVLKGDDAQTKDIYRNNRNLNFRSNLFELSARIEAGYQKIRRGGGSYGVQKNYSRYKNISHALYGYLGVGAFYFNPYGKTPDGRWVALKPLRTEGQGLPGGAKPYSNFNAGILFGAYYKFTLKKIWSVGVDICYRKTFTDYIDDVGSVYYNKNDLGAYFDEKDPSKKQDAIYMSDPNKGNIYGFSSPDASGNPAQRGDNEKDSYVSLEVSLSYIIKEKRKSARLRSKF